MPEILAEHGAVERADEIYIERCGFFEHALHLSAVFAHDAEIVAAGFAIPLLVDVEGAEFAEAVGGEEHLIRLIIGEHDLGPMHHRGENKGQFVPAERNA